ncbi:MAG: hypothetical protein FJ213_12515 [Ignavibacteria bacterium]|nr:hypothetical protein [Ignavibacteria bacterium]
MVMIQLPPDFRDFLKLLNLKKVEYLIIGGYAVGYYGYPKATGNIDIWISNKKSNAVKIAEVIKEFGFDVPDLSAALFTEENKITRMGVPPLRIELLTSISGVDFDECYKAKEVTMLDDVEVNFINLEHLKINKKSAGRYKDLDDLENLP